MDDRRFDSLARSLANGASRRSVLKGILGLGSAALAGSVPLEGETEAARRPAPTPTPPKCPGNQIAVNGVCTCPGAAPFKCGPACCTGEAGDPPSPTHTECCDNACCQGTCYGEELCCPTNPGPGEQPPTHQVCRSANGVECCPADQHCCEVDGCCDTVCRGGENDSSTCCPPGAFCPGDGSPDICCTDNLVCCGAGTSGNACLDPSREGACCSAADCTESQVCFASVCSCKPGTFDDANGNCPACAPGTYSDTPGAGSCTNCDLNFYQDRSGQTSCIPCPDGTYTEHVAQITCIACDCQAGNMPPVCNCTVTCQPGSAPDESGQCAPCFGGTHSIDGTACIPCDPGTFASSGAVSCNTCSPGTYSAGGASICSECGPGTYQGSTGQASCNPCPAGTFTTLAGSTQCFGCACGPTCNPATGNCGGIIGVGGACVSDDDCASGICGCGSPPGLPECMCRAESCFAEGEDCSSGFGAAWCCAGDCAGNDQNGYFCVTPV